MAVNFFVLPLSYFLLHQNVPAKFKNSSGWDRTNDLSLNRRMHTTSELPRNKVREKDLNFRPFGYEPNELPTALSRITFTFSISIKSI